MVNLPWWPVGLLVTAEFGPPALCLSATCSETWPFMPLEATMDISRMNDIVCKQCISYFDDKKDSVEIISKPSVAQRAGGIKEIQRNGHVQ